MIFALTTRWNAKRHVHGEAMVDEIRDLGFSHIELGYDTRRDLVPGVLNRISDGTVRVDSVHNYCPVPRSCPRGHPELFTLAHRDPDIRRKAIEHTSETIRFAAQVGARVVVAHAGNVAMRSLTRKLIALQERGKQFSLRYERLMFKLQQRRDRKAGGQFDHLLHGLEALLPLLEELDVVLALEILPSWEAMPSELEFEQIFRRFKTPFIGYWHDMGHARIRENLGLINAVRWLERLSPHLAGLHIHDVAPPARDHVMPPHGDIPFERYRVFAERPDVLRVLEPSPGTPPDQIIEGLRTLRSLWENMEDSPSRAGRSGQERNT